MNKESYMTMVKEKEYYLVGARKSLLQLDGRMPRVYIIMGGSMEKYRETSGFSKVRLLGLGLCILTLAVWAGIEVTSYRAGKPSFLGMTYIVLFCGLLVWRYAVRYVYILTENELIIISKFLSFSRTFTVSLHLVESYSDKYVNSLFKRKGMSRFVHRYSSGDGRPTRMLVFAQQGKSHAVLFKVSDEFMKELKALVPKKKR